MNERVESITLREERRELWPEALVAALFVPAFALVAGPAGLVAGGVVLGTWYLLGTPYAIAIGHVAFVVATPAGGPIVDLALLWALFLALLVAPARRTPHLIAFGSSTILAVLALGALAWAVLQTGTTWIAAAVLVGGFALALYLLHRHELVVTDRVGEGEADGDFSAGPTDGDPHSTRSDNP